MNLPLQGTEKEAAEQARQDCAAYTEAFQRNDTAACIEIEKKYGLYGLSPQQVSEQLSDIAFPALKAGRAS